MSKGNRHLKRKKKKRNRRRNKQKKVIDRQAVDWHHILFQRKHWNKGYAKVLREHRYMGAYIPQYTLHRMIHNNVWDVPVPNDGCCKSAYLKILEAERQEEIDLQNDSLEKRIDLLINIWEEACPETVKALRSQKEVVSSFHQ